MIKKVILLDIDGVLVTTPSWKPVKNLSDGFAEFDSKAAQNLSKLISKTSADIILTTSHRNNFSIIQWEDIMHKRNIVINKIESMDSYIPEGGSNRLYQINQWFIKFSYQKIFVIIDDDSSLYNLPPFLKTKWVKTDFHLGFDNISYEKAITILGNSI